MSELVVGMKCGGSDGLSGITANPAVRRFSDMLVARGGSTVLTEVPEMFGAEGFLMNRCINKEVFEKAVSMIRRIVPKNYFSISHNEVDIRQPKPLGNRPRVVLQRLQDKSCHAPQKGGAAPIMDVIGYGRRLVVNKGIKHALWTWKRSCISNGDDSRSAPDPSSRQDAVHHSERRLRLLKLSTNSRLAENKKGSD